MELKIGRVKKMSESKTTKSDKEKLYDQVMREVYGDLWKGANEVSE